MLSLQEYCAIKKGSETAAQIQRKNKGKIKALDSFKTEQ